MYSIRMIYPPHAPNPTVAPVKGRGAVSNAEGRYAKSIATVEDDGWHQDDIPPPPRPTELLIDRTRRIITYNDADFVHFDRSINPYKGCEHGCIYCFARPSHSYLDLSPGLDFETKIAYKPDALKLLQQELAKPGYRVAPIAFGTNTDPWQPVERELRVTRQLLEFLYECRHPITVLTKGSLILRDVDLLAKFAEQNLVRAMVSVTTLDNELKAKLEPRASSGSTRLRAIRQLAAAGVPVGVMAAPMIPFINDHELEAILASAREAGASSAGYTLLRLPWEVKTLFSEWLQAHFPDRAERVMSVVRDIHGSPGNKDAKFLNRRDYTGAFATLMAQRFQIARRKAGYGARDRAPLDLTRFCPPRTPSPQGDLFA